MSRQRRRFLQRAGALSLLPAWLPGNAPPKAAAFRRSRPTDASWPSAAEWERLNQAVGGHLVKLDSPLAVCRSAPKGAACAKLVKELKNPYFIGDNVALTPAVQSAFAFAITGGEGPPAFPGLPGHEPDFVRARREAGAIDGAMKTLAGLAPRPASYVSEGNYFDRNWAQSYWGSNYSRLRAVKKKYDPNGLFFVHHGVGSEDWSADGFTRVKA